MEYYPTLVFANSEDTVGGGVWEGTVYIEIMIVASLIS